MWCIIYKSKDTFPDFSSTSNNLLSLYTNTKALCFAVIHELEIPLIIEMLLIK